MANEFVQTIADARVDAQSLSDFVFKPSGFKVVRRLAPTIDTLQFYINRFNTLDGDFKSSVSTAVSSLNNSVAEAEGKVAYIETTVQDAINNTAVEGGVLADTFVTATSNNGTIARTQREKNAEQVSIKDYGAIGDGTLHTVAEWTVIGSKVYYPNLAAIQADYPHVTSLTDSIDWAATQQAAFKANKVYAPEGGYVLNRVVKTPHRITPRSVGSLASGLHIFGDGVKTYFTRNDEGECTRIFNAEGTSTTQESDTANSLEACFAVHCPYTNITDMTIMSSRLGIYMGQDFTQPFTSLSSSTYSMFTNVTIHRCGTGILGLAVGGNHYIGLYNVNFYGCQIDYHLRASFWWKITQGRGDANNNRHSFIKVRSDGSRVGYWNECGDTNTFHSWHAENLSSTTTNTPYPVPHHLPADLPKGSCAFIFSGSNQLNKMTGCHAEACEWSLYNNGYRNTFIDNGMKPSLCTFIQTPHYWVDTFAQYGGGISTCDDFIFAVDDDFADPNAVYVGTGVGKTKTVTVTKEVAHEPMTSLKSRAKDYQIEFGALAKTVPLTIPIWADAISTINENTVIDIVFLARCDTVGQVATFSANLTINAMRTSVRSFNNYAMLVNSNVRTYYTTARTEAGQVVEFVLEKDSTGKTLNIVMTSPWDLSSGTLFVKQHTCKI